MEHKTLPFYSFAFHPEYIMWEIFSGQLAIVDYEFTRAFAYQISLFMSKEASKNSNKFSTPIQLAEELNEQPYLIMDGVTVLAYGSGFK